MRILRNILLAAALLTPGMAASQTQPVVVELYTSQGCSSCPPADSYLAELSKRSNVIALSLHVDYWDYMGWKDVFADPKHSKRQRRYAHVQEQRTVYTPQMIIQGQDLVVGSRKRDVEPRLKAHSGKPQVIDLTVSRKGKRLVIEVATKRFVGPSVVQLVRFTPKHKVAIKRGENRGRTLVYTNVVESWDVVGTWNGRGSERMSVSAAPNLEYAIIVQEKNNGPILAATTTR